MLNQGLGAILGMVSLVIVGRYIPVGDFGIVGFAMGLVGMLTFLGDLGFSSAHIKRMTEKNDPEECLGVYASVKMVLSSVLALATIILFFVWEKIFGFGYQNPETPAVTMIILGYYLLLNLQHIFIFTFQSRMQTALQEIPNLILNITRFITLVIVAVGGFGLYLFAATYLFAAIAAITTSGILFMRIGLKAKPPTSKMFKSYGIFAVPLILSAAVSVISVNIDKVMIQLFWTSEEVGHYYMSQRIVLLIMTLSSAIGALLFPAISQAHSRGNMENIRWMVRNAERYISLIILPVVVFFIVFPAEIFHIIGDGYLAAAQILQMHILYAFFVVMMSIYSYAAYGMNKPMVAAKVILAISLLNIGLNLVLIPSSSLDGLPFLKNGAIRAAFAALISYACGLILMKLYAKKNWGIGHNWHLIVQGAAAVVTALILFQMGNYLRPDRIYILVPYFFLGAGIFAGILWLSKELRKDDIIYLLDTINPAKMAAYIKDELDQGSNTRTTVRSLEEKSALDSDDDGKI